MAAKNRSALKKSLSRPLTAYCTPLTPWTIHLNSFNKKKKGGG